MEQSGWRNDSGYGRRGSRSARRKAIHTNYGNSFVYVIGKSVRIHEDDRGTINSCYHMDNKVTATCRIGNKNTVEPR